MFTNILLAVDGSAPSLNAAQQGIALAKSIKAKVTVVVVTIPWAAYFARELAVIVPDVLVPEAEYEYKRSAKAAHLLREVEADARSAGVAVKKVHRSHRDPLGMAQSAFSILALHRGLAPIVAHAIDGMSLLELPFRGNRELVAGTIGPVADRLATRLAGKADTLAAALSRVQLFDNDDERRAYRSLLARSSNSLGVHDIVGT